MKTKDGVEIKDGMMIWQIAIRERHCTIMSLSVHSADFYNNSQPEMTENSFSTKQAAIKDTIEHLEAMISHLKERFYD